MRLVVQFAGVLDRQHMASGGYCRRARIGIGEQCVGRHFVIGEPAAKLNFLRPAIRQTAQADVLPRYHAFEQNSAVFLNGHHRNHPRRRMSRIARMVQISSGGLPRVVVNVHGE